MGRAFFEQPFAKQESPTFHELKVEMSGYLDKILAILAEAEAARRRMEMRNENAAREVEFLGGEKFASEFMDPQKGESEKMLQAHANDVEKALGGKTLGENLFVQLPDAGQAQLLRETVEDMNSGKIDEMEEIPVGA